MFFITLHIHYNMLRKFLVTLGYFPKKWRQKRISKLIINYFIIYLEFCTRKTFHVVNTLNNLFTYISHFSSKKIIEWETVNGRNILLNGLRLYLKNKLFIKVRLVLKENTVVKLPIAFILSLNRNLGNLLIRHKKNTEKML